jgi:alkylation response protein AidB-like acyl-CoA dehydrogenase
MEITYQLTKKQDFFQRNINSFVNQKISPRVVETDRDEEFPREVMDQLAGNRLLGLLVPREEGGEGAGFLDLCLALEGIAKLCPTSALMCSVQNLGARLLSKQGKGAQKERYLPDLMAGKGIFGYALPEVVSLNLTDVSLSVSKERDGFVLNGTECYVVNGDVAEMMCLFAKDEQSVYGFLAEKETQGLKVTRQEGTRGAEARSTCKAVLENCRIPADNLMGEEGAGQEIMADLISEASCFTAARALGIAQGALDYAIQYSKQREQFGRQIGKFQAIQVILADMATRVEAARHLVYKAAAVLDQRGKERYRFSSIAKYFSSRMAMEVTADAVQVGGGYGYTKDYPLEKMMRNAQLNQILDGSNHSHQLAIAKSLLGDGFR